MVTSISKTGISFVRSFLLNIIRVFSLVFFFTQSAKKKITSKNKKMIRNDRDGWALSTQHPNCTIWQLKRRRITDNIKMYYKRREFESNKKKDSISKWNLYGRIQQQRQQQHQHKNRNIVSPVNSNWLLYQNMYIWSWMRRSTHGE